MRAVLAALLDAIAAGALAYLGFLVAVRVVPCRNLGECTVLSPLVFLFVLFALVVYFGNGYLLWRSTPGRRALGVRERSEEDDLNLSE